MSYDSSLRRSWDRVSITKSSILYTPPNPSPFYGRRTPRPGPGPDRILDLAQASSLNVELLGLRSQEREQLVDLNDRFATYIEKVRHLELQNRALLAELETLRRRRDDPSRLQALYEGQARGLRAAIDAEAGEKMQLAAERDYLRDVYEQTKARVDEEARRRADADEALRRAKEEAGLAALANFDAEAAAAALADELRFLKKVFAEEQAELQAQLQTPLFCSVVGVTTTAAPDLSSALRDIRAQYERLACKNMAAAEDWYKDKYARVAEGAARNNEAVHAIREETGEYRRMLQARSAEVEALRGLIHSLHRQLEELEEAQDKDVAKYQMKISELERDISEAKQEMARYLREYQDLLNVKMALDIEIAAYRKLLEGEEIRLAYPALPALN